MIGPSEAVYRMLTWFAKPMVIVATIAAVLTASVVLGMNGSPGWAATLFGLAGGLAVGRCFWSRLVRRCFWSSGDDEDNWPDDSGLYDPGLPL